MAINFLVITAIAILACLLVARLEGWLHAVIQALFAWVQSPAEVVHNVLVGDPDAEPGGGLSGWARRHFQEGIGHFSGERWWIWLLVGSVLLAPLTLVFMFGEFALMTATIRDAGLGGDLSYLAALAFVTLSTVLGLTLFDLLGVTGFMPWDRMRHRLGRRTLIGFVLLCCIGLVFISSAAGRYRDQQTDITGNAQATVQPASGEVAPPPSDPPTFKPVPQLTDSRSSAADAGAKTVISVGIPMFLTIGSILSGWSLGWILVGIYLVLLLLVAAFAHVAAWPLTVVRVFVLMFAQLCERLIELLAQPGRTIWNLVHNTTGGHGTGPLPPYEAPAHLPAPPPAQRAPPVQPEPPRQAGPELGSDGENPFAETDDATAPLTAAWDPFGMGAPHNGAGGGHGGWWSYGSAPFDAGRAFEQPEPVGAGRNGGSPS